MLTFTEIFILIIVIVLISSVIGLTLVNVVDKKLGELTINIPETKVVLRDEDMKKICSLNKIEHFKNTTNYTTAENYYNENFTTEKKMIKSEDKLIPENYSDKTYAPMNYNKRILDGKFASNSVENIKPSNYVFK